MSKISKILLVISVLSLLILFSARIILGGWINILYMPMVFAALSFLAAILIDYKFFIEFFTMRTTKHGLNMGSLILICLGLVVVLNYFSARHNLVWDLTSEKLNSLSKESQKVIDTLKSEIEIKAFYNGEEGLKDRKLISEAFVNYTSATNKIKLNLINALLEPEEASEYLDPEDEVRVFAVSEGRRIEVSPPYDENAVTSALVRVSREQTETVYFLSGHGEKDFELENLEGLSEFSKALQANGLQVSKLNLAKGDSLEGKNGVLAIVGPDTALLDSELEQIRDFMKSGGKLFLAIDPGRNHQLALLTKPLGVEFKNNFIISDRARLMNAGPATILGVGFDPKSEITKNFALTDQFALLMLSSELAIARDIQQGWQASELLRTVPSAYSINELKVKVDPSQIERKSHALGVSVVGQQVEDKEFRFVAFGDSDFLTNRVLYNGINRELALNSIAFLLKDEALINVTPKIAEGTKMTITSTGQLAAVGAGVLVPLMLIVLSGALWIRRKNL